MPDIMVLCACVSQCLDTTTRRPLRRVTEAMLAMTGRVPMRGLSRWAGPGGSDRTLQRVCITSLRWATRHGALMRHHLWDPEEGILLGGDDVVVTKAGKHTHGWERFFSSLYGTMVRGLGCLRLSLMRVKRRPSSPVMLAHLAPPHLAIPHEVSKHTAQGQRGRPTGRQNQPRRDVTLSPSLRVVQETTKRVLQLIGAQGQGMSLVFDGALGHHDARHRVRQRG
jgi:putative transposase